MTVAEIPVAAVKIVGHQRRGKVQELHEQQPRHGGGQVGAQRAAQVYIFGGQPHQRRQEKPHIVPVPGGEGRVRQHQRRQHRLPAPGVAGQQQDLGAQQQHRAAGQRQTGQTAQAGQRGLYIGTEHFGQDQQQHQRGAEYALRQHPAAVLPRVQGGEALQ